jgi:hypothetical protein
MIFAGSSLRVAHAATSTARSRAVRAVTRDREGVDMLGR